jgi:AcrR family transcriptional regulator
MQDMAGTSGGPTGLARRGRRLSDRETGQRMLDAAVAMVNRTGLTVSLDHISFEEVIRDAGVSRSAVYRRWPHKDLFFGDLVKELARTATPDIEQAELELIRQVVNEHLDWTRTPELRRMLLMELIQRLALFDFQALYGSAQWRTYVALHATFLSLADGELREEVGAALAQSEREHLARVAAAWELLSGLFGYRLRPELGASFETLAMLLDATMRGLVVMALSMAEVTSYRAGGNPPGAAGPGGWSLAALGGVSLADTFLEPDPAAEWDDERVATLTRVLAEGILPADRGSPGRD